MIRRVFPLFALLAAVLCTSCASVPAPRSGLEAVAQARVTLNETIALATKLGDLTTPAQETELLHLFSEADNTLRVAEALADNDRDVSGDLVQVQALLQRASNVLREVKR